MLHADIKKAKEQGKVVKIVTVVNPDLQSKILDHFSIDTLEKMSEKEENRGFSMVCETETHFIVLKGHAREAVAIRALCEKQMKADERKWNVQVFVLSTLELSEEKLDTYRTVYEAVKDENRYWKPSQEELLSDPETHLDNTFARLVAESDIEEI